MNEAITMQNATCIIKAIIVHNFRFLVLVRSRDGLPDLPGGHLEAGETIEQCLIRELTEETQLVDGNLTLVNQRFLLTRTGIRLAGMTYRCELLAGSVTLSDEHNGFYWQDLVKVSQFTPREWVRGFTYSIKKGETV